MTQFDNAGAEETDEPKGLMDFAVLALGGFAVLIVFVALIHLLFSLEPELPQALDGPVLTSPVPYSATVTQRDADGKEHTRYYTPRETK